MIISIPSSSLTKKHPQPAAFSSQLSIILPQHEHTHTKLPFIRVHPSLCLRNLKLSCTSVAPRLSGLLPGQKSDGFVFIRPSDLPSGHALATLPRL